MLSNFGIFYFKLFLIQDGRSTATTKDTLIQSLNNQLSYAVFNWCKVIQTCNFDCIHVMQVKLLIPHLTLQSDHTIHQWWWFFLFWCQSHRQESFLSFWLASIVKKVNKPKLFHGTVMVYMNKTSLLKPGRYV